VIYPTDEAIVFEKMAKENGLFISRLTHVIPQHGAKEKRRLMQFCQNVNACSTENEIYIETNGRHIYSQEYIMLTKDFYLKFDSEK
jgi:tRNA1Val (adenine37-N6)-methyltransferase